MHQTHEDPRTPIRRRALLAGALIILATGIGPTPTTARPAPPRPESHHHADPDAAAAKPHVLDGEVASVIVHVRGSDVCSGTPIAGTVFVITAAHCVLDRDGRVTPSTVQRDGIDYAAVAALVDPRYHDTPLPEFDGAVLVMDQVIPGPAAMLGHAVPRDGVVTLAGFQPIDTDGTLLRGTNPHNRPLPSDAKGGYIKVNNAAAGCVAQSGSVGIAANRLTIGCGLIPGASGGGLFASSSGELVLIGVTSTVSADLGSNGLVPIANIRRLLDDRLLYFHSFTDIERDTPAVSIGTRLVS